MRLSPRRAPSGGPHANPKPKPPSEAPTNSMEIYFRARDRPPGVCRTFEGSILTSASLCPAGSLCSATAVQSLPSVSSAQVTRCSRVCVTLNTIPMASKGLRLPSYPKNPNHLPPPPPPVLNTPTHPLMDGNYTSDFRIYVEPCLTNP